MIIPIRCFTCGKVLADKWNYYSKRCKELEADYEDKLKQDLEKDSDAAPAPLSSTARNFEVVKKGVILDELGLNKMCCRRHMLTHIDMIKVI